MNMLKVVFLSFLMFSIPAQSMQIGKEVTERLSRFNLRPIQRFSSQQKIRNDMLSKTPSIFKGSQPKKQFSAKDLIKDDTVIRLITYAKPINYEGTLLKVKKREYHKEIAALKQFSVLSTSSIVDNKSLDGFLPELQPMRSLMSLEQAMKRLFTGVNPIRRPIINLLEKEFFIEKRKNTTVEKINDRMLYVRDDSLKENEKHLEE